MMDKRQFLGLLGTIWFVGGIGTLESPPAAIVMLLIGAVLLTVGFFTRRQE